jgi:hypothetical protein
MKKGSSKLLIRNLREMEEKSNEFYTVLPTEKIKEINYEVLSENPEVVKMLKQKIELEKKIQALDEFALVLLELQILAID